MSVHLLSPFPVAIMAHQHESRTPLARTSIYKFCAVGFDAAIEFVVADVKQFDYLDDNVAKMVIESRLYLKTAL